MAVWRYYVKPIAGPGAGSIRAEVPLTSSSVTHRLNGPGSLTGRMSCRHPAATPANLDTENTLLVATRDNVVMFAGPLLGADLAVGDDNIELRCEGAWNLVRRRVLRSAAGMTYGAVSNGEVTFDGVEQFDIVADLLAHMQSISGGDLGIDVAYAAPSGVARDRSYEADKGKKVGELVEQLAAVDNGFDWQLEAAGTVDDLELTLRLSYPLRGRDTGYRFDYSDAVDADGLAGGSSNVLGAGMTTASDELVTRFTGVGEGEGSTQLVAHVADPNQLGVLPLLEGANAWSDVSDPDTLEGHARGSLTVNGRASRLPLLRLNPNAHPRVGSYIVGDIVGATIRRGYFVNVDGKYRLLAFTIGADDTGEEAVDVELAELGRF